MWLLTLMPTPVYFSFVVVVVCEPLPHPRDRQQPWQLLHAGAPDGDCKNYLGASGEICSVPSERYYHGAAVFNDSTMLIYGGFSHRCEVSSTLVACDGSACASALLPRSCTPRQTLFF